MSKICQLGWANWLDPTLRPFFFESLGHSDRQKCESLTVGGFCGFCQYSKCLNRFHTIWYHLTSLDKHRCFLHFGRKFWSQLKSRPLRGILDQAGCVSSISVAQETYGWNIGRVSCVWLSCPFFQWTLRKSKVIITLLFLKLIAGNISQLVTKFECGSSTFWNVGWFLGVLSHHSVVMPGHSGLQSLDCRPVFHASSRRGSSPVMCRESGMQNWSASSKRGAVWVALCFAGMENMASPALGGLKNSWKTFKTSLELSWAFKILWSRDFFQFRDVFGLVCDVRCRNITDNVSSAKLLCENES